MSIFSDSDYTREYHAHKKKVHSVAWNSNGQRLASGSTDKTARVWALDDHRKVAQHSARNLRQNPCHWGIPSTIAQYECNATLTLIALAVGSSNPVARWLLHCSE